MTFWSANFDMSDVYLTSAAKGLSANVHSTLHMGISTRITPRDDTAHTQSAQGSNLT